MAIRNKILVVDSDLDSLSKIYLALVHRHYKAEASDKPEEIEERLKRFKPELLIICQKEFLKMQEKLKIPAIVLRDKNDIELIAADGEFISMEKPVHTDQLMRNIGELVY